MKICRRCKNKYPDNEMSTIGYCYECRRIMLRLNKRRKRLAQLKDNFYLYILIDPRTSQPRYVGIATNCNRRLAGHLNEARYNHGSNPAKNSWIAELLANELEPVMLVVDQRPQAEINNREMEALGLLRKQGYDMLNMNGYAIAEILANRRDKFARREFEAKETYKVGRRTRKARGQTPNN